MNKLGFKPEGSVKMKDYRIRDIMSGETWGFNFQPEYEKGTTETPALRLKRIKELIPMDNTSTVSCSVRLPSGDKYNMLLTTDFAPYRDDLVLVRYRLGDKIKDAKVEEDNSLGKTDKVLDDEG